MSFQLSTASEAKLLGVHQDLVKVVRGAILHSKVDFRVVEGVRTLEKQREYFLAGRSRTMNSRHLTGHAVDLIPLIDLDGDGKSEVTWELEHFYPINDAMQATASAFGIAITWGGSWAKFVDAPHFELSRSKYP